MSDKAMSSTSTTPEPTLPRQLTEPAFFESVSSTSSNETEELIDQEHDMDEFQLWLEGERMEQRFQRLMHWRFSTTVPEGEVDPTLQENVERFYVMRASGYEVHEAIKQIFCTGDFGWTFGVDVETFRRLIPIDRPDPNDPFFWQELCVVYPELATGWNPLSVNERSMLWSEDLLRRLATNPRLANGFVAGIPMGVDSALGVPGRVYEGIDAAKAMLSYYSTLLGLWQHLPMWIKIDANGEPIPLTR